MRMSRFLRPLALAPLLCFPSCSFSDNSTPETSTPAPHVPLWGDVPHQRPSCVRGIHLTAWVTGSKKRRADIETLLAETEVNTVVIAVKEIDGAVYLPGITLDGHDVYVSAIRDVKEYLKYLKDRGIFTIARVVVFKDQKLAELKPEWAVKSDPPLPKALEKGLAPDVWVDKAGKAWADPYNRHVWDYNISIAQKAVELGFQGIQFDYIRFPSDGAIDQCRYSKPHSQAAAVKNLAGFLEAAHHKLKPLGVEISIDVFGLVGSYDNDLGIGQKLSDITDHIDVLSPMMYPSHYAPGEYGLKNPNASPYQTVYRSIQDTLKIIRPKKTLQLRPYLQDFSLGVKYTAQHVRDQIEAAGDLGVHEWLLWSPSCRYTKEALKSQ